jgi:hypothetical protein
MALLARGLALFALAALVGEPAHVPVRAAEIAGLYRNGQTTIRISGDIAEGDFERFQKQLDSAPADRVRLDSRGGMIGEALAIGQLLREKKLTTIVGDGEECDSACAIIWLSGTRRVIEGKGKVGFHAVYESLEGPQISPSGNALVGAHLSRLGLGNDAIVYATRAQPEDLRWLTPADAWFLSIDTVWERATPPRPNIVGRSLVEFALRKERLALLLKGRQPFEYEQFVNDVYDARLEGQSWLNALYTSMSRLRLPPGAMRSFKAALNEVHGSRLIDISFVRFGGYMAGKNDEACFKLFEDGTNHEQLLFEHASDELKKDYLDYLADSLETALQDQHLSLQPVSAADRRYQSRQMDRYLRQAFEKLKSGERKRLRRAKDTEEKLLRCKLYSAALRYGLKDRRFVRTLLQPETAEPARQAKPAKPAG